MTPLPAEVDRAEEAIRARLATHPRNVDNLEGVHRWWIARLTSRAATEAALERLAEAGAVERIVVGYCELWRVPIPPL